MVGEAWGCTVGGSKFYLRISSIKPTKKFINTTISQTKKFKIKRPCGPLAMEFKIVREFNAVHKSIAKMCNPSISK